MPRPKGSDHYNYKGGRYKTRKGCIMVLMPEHPRASSKGYVYEHIVIAESMLGKPLPLGAVVHHHDEDPSNNTPENLCICENDYIHKQLHVKIRAYKACGHPDWLKCYICGEYDIVDNLSVTNRITSKSSGPCVYHKKCAAALRRKQRQGGQHEQAEEVSMD